jgi:TonB family protein
MIISNFPLRLFRIRWWCWVLLLIGVFGTYRLVGEGATPSKVEPEMNRVYGLDEVSKIPVAVVSSAAEYPFELRRKGIAGEVDVEAVVNVDGKVLEARVSYSTHSGFNDAALAGVKGTKFQPGEIEGRPVKTRMSIPVTFSLGPTLPRVLITKPVYGLKDLTSPPVLLEQVAPRYPPHQRWGDGTPGEVLLEFVVTDTGRLVNRRVIRSTDETFTDEAILALKKWRFKPGEINGVPVHTRLVVPFEFKISTPAPAPQSSPQRMKAAITLGSLLLCALVFACAMIWTAVEGASGGDFTWRMQAIIGHLKVPLPAVWVLAIAVVAFGLRREPRRQRRVCWTASLGLLFAGFAVSSYCQVVLESAILSWNPNWPPPDWESARDRWFAWNWGRAGAASLSLIFLLSSLALREPAAPDGS